jgi:CDP-diacylglycerol---serine O-phosphatidyltransferase
VSGSAASAVAARSATNRRLRRGIAIIPSLFTATNLSLGYLAVINTLQATTPAFDIAAKAIGLAIVCDALDGRIARATGTNSEFGKQFDSLADVISFGIAPAFLAFTWGSRAFATHEPGLYRNVYWFGILATAMFVTCCAWRLARFNIQGMAPGTEAKYFVGMPTPGAAGVIAAAVHALKEPVADWRFSMVWMLVVAGLAWLMTSTIRFYGFKDINLTRRRSSLVVPLLMLLGLAIFAYSEWVLIFLALSYMVAGVVLHVVRNVRRPKPA